MRRLTMLSLALAILGSGMATAPSAQAKPFWQTKVGRILKTIGEGLSGQGGTSTHGATEFTFTCTFGSDGGGIAVPRGHDEGEYKEISWTFTGCQSQGSSCRSAGAEAGEINTAELSSELGYINEKEQAVGLELKPAKAKSAFARFECGSDVWELKGAVIARISPIDQPTELFTMAYNESEGQQEITQLEGGKKAVLEATVTSSTTKKKQKLEHFGLGTIDYGMPSEGTLEISTAPAPGGLQLSTRKGVLAAGAEIAASSTNLVFATAAGNLECSSNLLAGTLSTNERSSDAGAFTTESSAGHEAENACKTTMPFGPALITSSAFPWAATFTTKGTDAITGTKKVTFSAHFPDAGNITCVFESSKLDSTFGVGGPLELSMANQLFKRSKKGSNAACPVEGELSGTFALTSEGEAIESIL